MKVVDYTVARAHSLDVNDGTFSFEVAHFIKQGWQPLGGLVIFQSYVYQALVKYEV